MKTITLVRHAAAVRFQHDKPDFERPLKTKGELQSHQMARKIKSLELPPSLLVSSSANRALDTAIIFANILQIPEDQIIKTRGLYEALSPDDFLTELHQLDNSYQHVMLFGHNPGFSHFAAAMLSDFNANIPKCGAVCIKTKRRSWRTLALGDGELAFFEKPENLAQNILTTKDLRKRMQPEIESSLKAVLSEFAVPATKEVISEVKKSSKKLAKYFAAVSKI